MSASSKKRTAPGGSSLEAARTLIALTASLSESGDTLSVEGVAQRLQVSPERAEQLLELLQTSATHDGVGLPLIQDDEGELTLSLVDNGVRGKAVQLTEREVLALRAALDWLHLPQDDPLRAQLTPVLGSDALNQRVSQLYHTQNANEHDAQALELCSRALATQSELYFLYQRVGEKNAEQRRVAPLHLTYQQDAWYLSAYDLDKHAQRVFRLDRMDALELGRRTSVPQHADDSSEQDVVLTFCESRWLEELPWGEMVRVSSKNDPTPRYRTRWFGGRWLARLIAATAGGVTCDNAELITEVAHYLAEQRTQFSRQEQES